MKMMLATSQQYYCLEDHKRITKNYQMNWHVILIWGYLYALVIFFILCGFTVFRMGKYLDMLQGAARSLAVRDTALRLMILSARLSRMFYFLVDQIVWAARIGIYKSDAKAWSKFQAKIWSLALIFCVARNFYDIYNIFIMADKKSEDSGIQKACWYKRLQSRPEVLLDTVKNCADFLIPLNVMGAVEVNNGFIGILGVISSLAGLSTVWQPALKLKP